MSCFASKQAFEGIEMESDSEYSDHVGASQPPSPLNSVYDGDLEGKVLYACYDMPPIGQCSRYDTTVPANLVDPIKATDKSEAPSNQTHSSTYAHVLRSPSSKMKALSCPFTWDIAALHPEEICLMVDRLPLAVTPWEGIIRRCKVAYSEFIRGSIKTGSAYLSTCYIPILEVQGLETTCSLTKLYRPALKHVLDSTSAYLRLPLCEDDKSCERLYNFVRTIHCVGSMDNKQKAAILAIRSKFSSYPENVKWAQEAIKLNPDEGQWHSDLSFAMFKADRDGHLSDDERDGLVGQILKHNSDAIIMRRDAPEPLLLMADLLVDNGESATSEQSYMLVQNALKKFPDNAYVHEKSADILTKSQVTFEFLPKSYFLIEPFYKKALKLAGKECLSLRHKLGIHQVLLGKFRIENYEGTYDEGIENLEKAATLFSDARDHLQLANEGKLQVNIFGRTSMPPMLLAHEETTSSSSEELAEKKNPDVHEQKKRRQKRRMLVDRTQV